MTVGFTGRIGSSNRGGENDYTSNKPTEGNRYGINPNDFYKVDENGNKIFDITAYLDALDEAKSESAESSADEAGQADCFCSSTNVNGTAQKDTRETKTAKDTIDEEYENAVEDHYNIFENSDLAGEASSKAEDAWEAVHDKEKDLTEIGVTNATVIAGVSEFVSLIEKAVSTTNEAMESEEKQETEVTLETETESDETEDSLFGNNPFMTSAFETSDIEEEETIAA